MHNIDRHKDLLEKVWPGRVSVAFGEDSAIRVPDKKELREFLLKVGPVVSTSCNLSGQPAIISTKEAQEVFGEEIDYYLEANEEDNQSSSTIIKIIR